MVDGLEGALRRGLDDRVRGDEARQVGAGVVLALHERVAGLAVGGDRGQHDRAVLVLDLVRLVQAARAVLDGVGVGGAGVRDLDGEVDDAVAVLGHVLGQEAAAVRGRLDDRGQDEARGAVGQDVAGGLAGAVLRSGVGHELHAEGGRVVVRGLLGIAHGEDDGVHALHREGVGLTRGVRGGFQVRQRLSHERRVPPIHKLRNSFEICCTYCAAQAQDD